MSKNKFIEYSPDTTPEEIGYLSQSRDTNDDESTRFAVSLLRTDRFEDAYNYEVMANHAIGSIEIKDSEGYRVSYDLVSNQRAFINYMELQSRNQLLCGELSQLYIEELPYPIVLVNGDSIQLNIELLDKNITRCILQPNILVYKLDKEKRQIIDISNETTITINYTISDDADVKNINRPYNSAGKLISIPKGKLLNSINTIDIEVPQISNENDNEKHIIIVNDVIISYM